MNAKDLLKKALTDMGADGLYNREGDGEESCGCGFDDFALCGCDFWDCVPAKKEGNNNFYPMEVTCPKT
jgi:hypothetical protein